MAFFATHQADQNCILGVFYKTLWYLDESKMNWENVLHDESFLHFLLAVTCRWPSRRFPPQTQRIFGIAVRTLEILWICTMTKNFRNKVLCLPKVTRCHINCTNVCSGTKKIKKSIMLHATIKCIALLQHF